MGKPYYLTTTLPYVNADPHIGFALEIIQADTTARYRRLSGDEVFFNFGTDEHGQKIYQKAVDSGKDPQDYVNEYAARFDNLKIALNLSFDNFIRTTDSNHIKAAQEFWKICDKAGDIYKKLYQTKYCVGCELEKTDSELVDGRCPLHPSLEIELIEEENYFFRFSKYQDNLLELYNDNPGFVIPPHRLTEIANFVEAGLNDFSISRLKEKMPWGIEVPGDPEHVMYVWFDALINYISAIGWPDEQKFSKWWPVIQFAGKDNLRQQAAIWQAMLMSAGLPPSEQIFIHGFITVNGQKISKSGNSIDPLPLVEEYGVDAVRYYLLAKVHPFEDSDFTMEKFREAYTADLANGLGNLVSRVAKLAENHEFSPAPTIDISPAVGKKLDDYEYSNALEIIWAAVAVADREFSEQAPWTLTGETQKSVVEKQVIALRQIAVDLEPFMPDTAQRIRSQFEGTKILSGNPLFPRLDRRVTY